MSDGLDIATLKAAFAFAQPSESSKEKVAVGAFPLLVAEIERLRDWLATPSPQDALVVLEEMLDECDKFTSGYYRQAVQEAIARVSTASARDVARRA